MAQDSFKIKKSINLEPGSPTMDTEGDVGFDSSTHKLKYRDNSATRNVVSEDGTQTLTNKTISGASNTISNVSLSSQVTGTLPVANGGTNSTTALNNNRVMQSSSGAITEAAAITASRALISDANGIPTHSTVTSTTLGYLDATSSVQTQLDAKVAKTLTTTTGDMIYASSANTPARLAIGSSGQVLKVSGGIPTWAAAPSGGINYISPSNDGEDGTVGTWATYADAAGTSPVDGTGGSPSVTWTASNSSPLIGSYSFLLTKGASNRQGDGASIAFTIDSAFKGKVLQGSFSYSISSGTFADNDVSIWIYDVTNSTLIQPAPYQLKNHSLASEQFGFEFQTSSSSTSYRLIIHVASTSASAYTLKFDDFKVGPQAKLYGSPVTDWQSYSLTIKGSTADPTQGSGALKTAIWRRVGDSVEIIFQYQQTNAGSAGTGTYYFPLPSGMTIDTSKIDATNNGNNFGSAYFYDGTNERIGFVRYYSTTAVTMAQYDGANAVSNVSASVHALSNTNVRYGFRALVPIVGWGSSAIMSQDAADSRVVAARATRSSAQSVNNATATKIQINSSTFDTHGGLDVATNYRYTIQVPGKYRISGTADFAASGTGTRYLYVYKNGSLAAEIARQAGTSGDNNLMGGSTTLDLVTGDYIEFYCYQNSGGALNVGPGGSNYNHYEIEKLQGPNQIAASESVNARYSTNAAQSISNSSYTIIDFEDKSFDSHNSVTTGASWKFTCQSAGVYEVNASILMETGGGWAAAERVDMALYKNGVYVSEVFNHQTATHSTYVSGRFHDMIKLVAGDYIDLRVVQSSGASVALTAANEYNFINIKRVGNY